MPSLTLDLPCPACGATATDELASRDEILAEVAAVRAFHQRRLRPDTPASALTDRVVFSQDPALRLASCRGCGTVLREPRERPRAIQELYAGEAPRAAALESLFQAQRREYRAQARRLTRALGHTGAGLEVGSYVGAFLAAARERGWRFEGVDVNPEATRFAAEHGFAVAEGTLEDVVPGRRFDAVAIWNCFEQLPDPRASARAARELLRPGGVLAVRVPNGACYARLRGRLGGPAAGPARATLVLNNLLTFPYRHGFTASSLRRLMREEGFRVERVLGDVLVRTADRWTLPWAAAEERAAKAVLRPLARLNPARAPWLELYARKL